MSAKINAALHWWLQGLTWLLPASVRDRLWHIPDYIAVTRKDTTATFTLCRGGSDEPLDTRVLDLGDGVAKNRINDWLGQNSAGLIALLPEQVVLKKSLNYPLASEKALDSILEHEIDKQTPFSSDRVYFDYRVTHRDSGNKSLGIDLVVVLRDSLDDFLQSFNFMMRDFSRVTCPGYEQTTDINLLPAADGAATGTGPGRTGLLALAAVVLLVLALYLPLARHEGILVELEQQVTASRAAALEAQALLQRKEQLVARGEFLQRQAANRTRMITVIRELTDIFPDHTWVNRILIRGDELQIYGESDAATAVIELIDNSEFFSDPRFRSPVNRNTATGKDRFHVSATVVQGTS